MSDEDLQIRTQVTLRGAFLNSLIDIVKREKGLEGIEYLIQNGFLQRYNNGKFYPIEEYVLLADKTMFVCWGSSDEQNWKRLGAEAYGVFSQTITGKTYVRLCKNNLQKALMLAQNTLSPFIQGILFQSRYDPQEQWIEFNIYAGKEPASFWESLIGIVAREIGYTLKPLIVRTHRDSHCEIQAKIWQEQV